MDARPVGGAGSHAPSPHDQRGTSLAIAAYLTAGLGLAQLLGSPAGATVMARIGEVGVLVGGMAIVLVATVLVPLAPGVAGPFVCVVIAGFLTPAMLPALLGVGTRGGVGS